MDAAFGRGRAAARFSLAARGRSFVYAVRGLAVMVASQHNARVHAVATVAVVAAGAIVGVGRYDWVALTFAMALVWMAEAVNTALELLCDVASPDFHPLIGRAKDVAAGAVLVAAVSAAFCAFVVFYSALCAPL